MPRKLFQVTGTEPVKILVKNMTTNVGEELAYTEYTFHLQRKETPKH